MLKYYIYFEKCGPQIWLCLLMFRPIAMKQLKSMTLINLFKLLDGLEVTHQIAVREVPGSIPDSGNDFYVCSLFCCCCVFYFFVQNTLFFMQFLQSFWNDNSFSILYTRLHV